RKRAMERLRENIVAEHDNGKDHSMGREQRAKRTVKELIERELEHTQASWRVRWLLAHPRTCYTIITLLAPIYWLGGHSAQWSHHRDLLKMLYQFPNERIAP